jgi:hypothetical protein
MCSSRGLSKDGQATLEMRPLLLARMELSLIMTERMLLTVVQTMTMGIPTSTLSGTAGVAVEYLKHFELILNISW